MKTGAPVIIGSAAKVVGTAAGTATAGLLISTGVLAPPAPVVGSAVDFGATAVIGVGGSMVFDYVYDNFDTSGKGLEWTKTIQTGMKKREEDAKQLRKKL